MATVSDAVSELTGHPAWPAVRAVGVGCAGPLDASLGTVAPINIRAWQDFPLVARLRDLAGGSHPIGLAGDGGRWRRPSTGAAAGARDAVCLVVSTGVGGGLIVGGERCPGPTGNAGHIGHIIAEPDGVLCACGAKGCVETAASGPAILSWALQQAWHPPGGATAATSAEVASSARAGNPIALAAADRAARAVAVTGVTNMTEARLAVIGGGVAESGDLLFDPLRTHVEAFTHLAFARSVTIRPAALGPNAGLIGAAALARHLPSV